MPYAVDAVNADLAPGRAAAATTPDALRGTPPTRRDALSALAVAAVVTVMAWWWRSPMVPTDPYHYVAQTLEFPSDNWVALGLSRYGIFLANIPPALLFKDAQATYYFWPLLSTALLAAMVYLLARRFWGVTAGLVAVTVLFSNSLVLYNLTRFYPDVMAIALVYAAAFCALMARDRGFSGRSGLLWLLLTGFFLGWSFEVRETAMLSWPIVMLLLWKRGALLRAFGIAAITVGLWLALDVGISWFVYGDPLLKVHVLLGENPAGAGYAPPVRPDAASEPEQYSRWHWFLTIPRTALETRPDGVWVVLSGIVAALAVVVRNRPLRVFSAGFIAVYALNLLAGGVLLPQRPFGDLSNSRYWIQYFPAIALVLGGLTASGHPLAGRQAGRHGCGVGAMGRDAGRGGRCLCGSGVARPAVPHEHRGLRAQRWRCPGGAARLRGRLGLHGRHPVDGLPNTAAGADRPTAGLRRQGAVDRRGTPAHRGLGAAAG